MGKKLMTLAIIQARISSSRLPGKVLKEINDHPMIYWQLKRISKAKTISKIIVATSSSTSDDILVEYLDSIGVSVIRGPLNNVKARFDQVLQNYPFRQFVRLTADCPLVMPNIIDSIVNEFKRSNLDYLSNNLVPTYPDGLDVEVIRSSSFLSLNSKKLSRIESEHVTYALYSRPSEYLVKNFKNEVDLSSMRWTVDYKEDLDFVRKVYGNFKGREDEFDMSDVLGLLVSQPSLKNKIAGSRRNESLKRMLLGKNSGENNE